MRPVGLEPTLVSQQDPKSCASANSATVAGGSNVTGNCLGGQGFRPEETSAAASSAISEMGVDTAFCRMSERLTQHLAVSRQTQSQTQLVCDVEQLTEGPARAWPGVPAVDRQLSDVLSDRI